MKQRFDDILLIASASRWAKDVSEANIVTPSDLLSFPRKWSKVGRACVFAELSWDGRTFSRFHGFEILCKLRMEYRLLCPIAVCSFMPKEYLSRRFPILSGFGGDYHPFVQLPATPQKILEEINKAESATEPALDDIIRRFCHPVQRVGYLLTHGKGFKGILRGDVSQEACASDVALFKRYLISNPLTTLQLTLANRFVLTLETALTDGSVGAALNTKKLLLEVLDSLSDHKER